MSWWSLVIVPDNYSGLVIRPPVRSNGRSYKMLVMFSFFQRVISELPRPITAKLRHMIADCVYFINWLQKFGEPSPQKNWEPKTCKISVDSIQPSTLIANISGTAYDIQNLKTNWSTAIPSALYEKGPVNFGPLITETKMWVRTHQNARYNISALRGCCALKFLHALQIDEALLAHTWTGRGVPPKKKILSWKIKIWPKI